MAPEVIGGRYRVKSAIGHGGMGTVWLCTDETLGRDVAVKQVGMLPGESATDSARALREARSTATLNHRNVVSVFDIVEEAGSIWMVMEYVPSRTLGKIVREDGPLPPERVAAIGAQVADGLAAAHAAGVIHRDVKPANILVTDDGVAKIGDFGIARSVGDEPLTQAGLVTGTPAYFSPELAHGDEPGPGSDVWALGATLFTAVEGDPPYPRQPNPVAMLRTIATQPPATPQRAGFLAQALTRMLDRDPGSRWSMSDVAHALRRLEDRHRADRTRENTAAFAAPAAAEPAASPGSEPAPAPEADRTPPAPGPTGPPDDPREPDDRDRDRRGVGLLPLAAAVLLLLLVAGGGYLLLRDTGSGRAASRATAPTTTPSTPAGSPSKSPTRQPTHHTSPVSGAAAEERFLHDYYRTAPVDQDAGWSMVGPGIRQVGRSSYDDFWGGIDRVGVSDVRTAPGGSRPRLTLTYHFSNGRVTVERQRLDLIRSSDGGYLINGQQVLSSRTVRQ